MLIPPWRIFLIYSIAKKCAIFNMFGINNKLSDELVANSRQKKAPSTTFLAAEGVFVTGIRAL